ncbi:hypothetical protein KVT40_005461 [Elsinoe batatas]|uniref:Alcohol dehydrogenase-like N-terminal domain-containing protein n=1 Tax=Elsinoe batatas TaxID=2601811 RepID=A0A8K0KYJ2_9PEZI|nr:hypothetical protein KVT40_005461 [Elsinoe batatas]
MASMPQTQRVLSLPAIRQKYDLEHDQPIPTIQHGHEVLVETEVIGLNPIDWKAPDYGFGIPVLPYIPGRELVGHVVVPSSTNKRLKLGDRVALISTDYRDLRKATYQEYAISSHFNLVRLPRSVSSEQGAAIGVAFVTGALALGVCTGLDFSPISDGPDLVNLVRNIHPTRLPKDVREECVDGIPSYERPQRGDWLAIWGGSSTCAFIINQVARLAGLRTIIVLDVRKHANTLATDSAFEADFVVDSHDPVRAIEIVRSVTGGSLRFAIDVVGRTTSEYLAQCLQSYDAKSNEVTETTPPGTPPSDTADKTTETKGSHLTGLTGLPKHVTGAYHHSVPVKLFHEVPEVGEVLVLWLERLLDEGLIVPPRILGVVDGLEGVNDGLDQMRKGEISGGRLVARIR